MQDNGCFTIHIKAADEREFGIGPYNNEMHIDSRHVKSFSVCYDIGLIYHCKDMFQLNNGSVAMTSDELRLDTCFYRQVIKPETPILIDLDLQPFMITKGGSILSMHLSPQNVKFMLREYPFG